MMNLSTSTAAFAAFALLLGALPASAYDDQADYPTRDELPPVSGTLRVGPQDFGRGGYPEDGYRARRRVNPGSAYGWSAPARDFDQGIGPAYGYQGQAFGQLAEGSGGGYRAAHHTVDWRGDGTGLVGLIATQQEQPQRQAYLPEAPVQVAYGEPELWRSGPGYPPTGGLGHYGSGAPSTMAYYSSSSSAGPYGTPGGLGIYSSGSYGAPRILRVGYRRGYARHAAAPVCSCRPRIIELGRHSRSASRW